MTNKPHDDNYMSLALQIMWLGAECTTFTVKQIRLALIEGKTARDANIIAAQNSFAKINWVLKCIGAEKVTTNGRYTLPYFHPNTVIFWSDK